jgi:hypothetical protein
VEAIEVTMEKLAKEMAQYELRALFDEKGPVAYVTGCNNGFPVVESTNTNYLLPVGMALYTHPHRREWVELTDEEKEILYTKAAEEECSFSFAGAYILDGKTPVLEPNLIKWVSWFESANRVVQQDIMAIEGVKISTVFLGFDHSWVEGPPVLFETMIFGGNRDGETHRYRTWDDAEAGHQRVLNEVASGGRA